MRILTRIIRLLFGLGLTVALLGAVLAGITIWYFNRDLPDYTQLVNYRPPIVTRVFAGDGRLLAEYATEKRVFVPVQAMPPLLIRAFLAAEDKGFYSHAGVDPVAIARAAVTDLVRVMEHRRPEGASTITQQVAKNFFFSNEVSVTRKIKEILLAIKIEQALSKDRILELYLNQIFLGRGDYGVGAAALDYFGKSLDELTVGEAAFLAALPKAPNNYNPDRYPEAARVRRDWVIDRMVEAGFITPAQGDTAKAERLVMHRRDKTESVHADYFAEEVRRELLARYGDKELYEAGLVVRTSLDPHLQTIADQALRNGLIAYDRRHGYRGPVGHIDIRTDWWAKLKAMPLPAGADEVGWQLALVLDVDAQGVTIGFPDKSTGRVPFEELKWAAKPLDDARVGSPPKRPDDVLSVGDVVLTSPAEPPPAPTTRLRGHVVPTPVPAAAPAVPTFGLRQIPAISGAIVALDPHTGRVLAMTGGFSYEMSQFNRVTQAHRQTGSAIKPFVYAAALDHGFTPSSVVMDTPVTIDLGPGQAPWTPKNFEGRNGNGPTTLRVGLELSHDMMTVRVGQAIGLDAVGSVVERFGIMDQMPREYSMLLGAGETTVLRLTTAFAMLVNGGKHITPSLIDRIQDRNGNAIFRLDQRPCPTCLAADWTGQAPPKLPDTREQIEDPATAYQITHLLEGVVQRGTGRIVSSVGKPLAGKTGTSNGPNDTWFVGFSPDLTVGVYVGFDQPQGMGAREQGATCAAPIFRDFMTAALKDQPAIPFRVPPGIRMVRVDATTGQPPEAGDHNVLFEAFKPGTEPTGDPGPILGADDGGTIDSAAAQPGTASAAPGASAPGVPGVAAFPLRHGATPATGTGGLY